MQPIIIHRALLSDPTSCGAEQPFRSGSGLISPFYSIKRQTGHGCLLFARPWLFMSFQPWEDSCGFFFRRF